MTNTFWKYLVWATIQHALVLTAVWFWDYSVYLKPIMASTLFALMYIPNWKLASVAGTLANTGYWIMVLTTVFFSATAGWLVLIPLLVGHAFLGRYLVEKGWETRVLWEHPRWSS